MAVEWLDGVGTENMVDTVMNLIPAVSESESVSCKRICIMKVLRELIVSIAISGLVEITADNGESLRMGVKKLSHHIHLRPTLAVALHEA